MEDEKKKKKKFSFLNAIGMVSKAKEEPTINNTANVVKERKKKLAALDKELN